MKERREGHERGREVMFILNSLACLRVAWQCHDCRPGVMNSKTTAEATGCDGMRLKFIGSCTYPFWVVLASPIKSQNRSAGSRFSIRGCSKIHAISNVSLPVVPVQMINLHWMKGVSRQFYGNSADNLRS